MIPRLRDLFFPGRGFVFVFNGFLFVSMACLRFCVFLSARLQAHPADLLCPRDRHSDRPSAPLVAHISLEKPSRVLNKGSNLYSKPPEAATEVVDI